MRAEDDMHKLREMVLLCMALVVYLGLPQRAYSQTQAGSGALGTVDVRSVTIGHIDDTHLGLQLSLSLTPARSVSLAGLDLRALRINGIPVAAEPLRESLTLTAGKALYLPPLAVSVFYRDLRNTDALRDIVTGGKAHLQGEMIAALNLSFFEKLAVHTSAPTFYASFAENVPVVVGPIQRQAALLLFSVMDRALDGDTGLLARFPGLRSPWSRSLYAVGEANLVEVSSGYTVEDRHTRTTFPAMLTQLGFRLHSGVVIATAEIQEPWTFDPEFETHLSAGDVRIARGASVAVRRVSMDRTAAVPEAVAVDVSSRGKAETDVRLVKDGRTRIKVHRRASPGALTLLRVQDAPEGTGWLAVPPDVAAASEWTKVAVFRLLQGTSGKPPAFDVVELSAERVGNTIRLSQPLDPSAFGSPILTPQGVLGIVQDERAGTFLTNDL